MARFLTYRLWCEGTLPRLDSGIIATLNPHSVVVAQSDRAFRGALQAADVLTVDGIGLHVALTVSGRACCRITGREVFRQLLDRADAQRLNVLMLVAHSATGSKLVEALATDYPSVTVSTSVLPFPLRFTGQEDAALLSILRTTKPSMVFLGVGAPKQEKLAMRLHQNYPNTLYCCVGAVLQFTADPELDAPAVVGRFGLEWLYRLFKEPVRLWRRTMLSAPRFIALALRDAVAASRERRRRRPS